MQKRSRLVPVWLADTVVPVALLGLAVGFALAWRAGNNRALTFSGFLGPLMLVSAYVVGHVVATGLQRSIGRRLMRTAGWLGCITGLAILLFSFGGLRPAGIPVIGLGVAALVAGYRRAPARVAFVAPSPVQVSYFALVLIAPLALALLLPRGDGGEAQWTALALFDVYAAGFLGWSLARHHNSVVALFSASFCAFWGIAIGPLFAPLLLVAIAGLGGLAATLPWLWEGDRTEAAAAAFHPA